MDKCPVNAGFNIEAHRKAPLEQNYNDNLAFPLEVRLDYLIACKQWQAALDITDFRVGDSPQARNRSSSAACFPPAAQPVSFFAS